MFIAEATPNFNTVNRSHPIARGLVGCWRATPGMTSGNKWYDLSGRNNHGTLTNGPVWRGNALYFDGTNDYVTLGGPVYNPGSGHITVAAWINPSKTTIQTIIGNRTTGPFNFSFRGDTAGDPLMFTIYGVIDRFSSATNMTDGMHHVAVTYDKVNISFYVDGKWLSSHAQTGNFTAGSGNMLIGAVNNIGTPAGFFRGLVNDVRVYNRALSAAEIKSLYVDPLADLNRISIPVGTKVVAAPSASNISVMAYHHRRMQGMM